MKNAEAFRNPELDLETRLCDLLSRLTVEEKISLVPTEQAGIPRLGIKPYNIGSEGAHGFVDRSGPTTTFPQTIGLASTWDRALLRKIGTVIGTEARAWHNAHDSIGALSLWFPTIDMERDPRWGRTEEGYGEDPFLAGELASEVIRGTQGDDPFYALASCGPKHFFANNNERNRVSCSCSVDPRNMREYYLLPFRKAFLKGGARSLMTAYNEVNGIPLMQHPAVRDIVKGEWGLEGRGHVVTDGGDVGHTVNFHKYFESHAETIAAGFRNGADSMTDLPSLVIPAVREALGRGLIGEADLDRHVGNVLRLRFRFGHFDPPGTCPYDAIGEKDMMSAGAARLSREAVAKSVVLLKNEAVPDSGIPVLPLAPGSRVAVIGPLADAVYTDWYTGVPPYRVSPLAGLRDALGADSVEYECGLDVVSFATAEGAPLVLDSAGALAVGRFGDDAARFFRDDWGWGANSLRSVETGKYLDSIPEINASRQPDNDELAVMQADTAPVARAIPSPVRATAETTLNWFITTLFNIIPDALPPGSELTGTSAREIDLTATDLLESGLAGTAAVHPVTRVYLRAWNGTVLVHRGSGPVGLSRETESPSPFLMRVERSGAASAAALAKSADAVVVFAGSNPVINGKEEMDRPDLALPPRQRELAAAVLAANPRTALALVSGYPYALDSATLAAPAILWAAHGMQEGGNGLADALTGRVPPAGRLPLTWYRSAADLPPMMEYDVISSHATYRHFRGRVLFPFGHGLTYSRFAWRDLRIGDAPARETAAAGANGCGLAEIELSSGVVPAASAESGSCPASIAPGRPLSVSFELSNVGTVASDEVAQLYVRFEGSRVSRPLKALAGFERVRLEPGESRRVEFALEPECLEIWDVTRERYCLEKGDCELMIGPSSADIRLRATVPVSGEIIPPRRLDGVVAAQNYDAYRNCHLHERRGSDLPAVFSGAAPGIAAGYGPEPSASRNVSGEAGFNQSWIAFHTVDFGAGAREFSAKVLARTSMLGAPAIELRVGSPEGPLAGSEELPVTGDNCAVPGTPLRALWTGVRFPVTGLSGIRDLYMILRGDVGIQTFSIR